MTGCYIFRKRDLMKELEKLFDDDFIMINMGGHSKNNYPITNIEDSQCMGIWEIRCDANADFWEELEKARQNNEL